MSDTLEARIEKLEARVRELEDERAIRELLARYGFNADCKRNQAYVDLFTQDGAIGVSAGGDDTKTWRGKTEIAEFINDPSQHSSPGFWGRSMHMQGNNVAVHIDGDTATVNSYSVVLVRGGSAHLGAPALLTAGNNQWVFKKIDGAWFIKERRRANLGDDSYADNLDATPS